MKSWFATRKEAEVELKARKLKTTFDEQIFKWTHSKRLKPWFVGDFLAWMNK